jgi:hypothetical protein
MHPNGQIPAYEWAFSDVNPPVHAWAAHRVYQIEAKRTGKPDREFLEKIFTNCCSILRGGSTAKTPEGNNVFEGGFLGLDNIGVFDRNTKLPNGAHLEQSDGTSWMAMFCLNMLAIAVELAKEDPVYGDVASKFFEHFIYISDAMNNLGDENSELWNERDGFYYDVLHLEDKRNIPVKVRSMVGLIPLFAVETVEEKWLDHLPELKKRTAWFLENRADLTGDIAVCSSRAEKIAAFWQSSIKKNCEAFCVICWRKTNFYPITASARFRAFTERIRIVLKSKARNTQVRLRTGESTTEMFGGNSNWRGPVWFPMNFLLIESLQKFDFYYGDNFKIEFPTGSERMLTLWEISQELSKRLSNIFLKDADGNRAVFGNAEKFQQDEHWRDHLLFYEYFHGDRGAGLGASHQTGWTGLIGKLLQQIGEYAVEESGDYTETD